MVEKYNKTVSPENVEAITGLSAQFLSTFNDAMNLRQIAMKELTPSNALRTIRKEAVVGLLNGAIFALIIGFVVWIWFGSAALGGVLALAIIINLLAAGISGSALPLVLNRFGFDSAIASSAFLTSITDVLGFYVF